MAADARVTQVGVENEADTDTSTYEFRGTQAGVEVIADLDTTPFRFRITQAGIECMRDTLSRARAFAQWR